MLGREIPHFPCNRPDGETHSVPNRRYSFVQSNVYQLDIDYELSVTAYAAGDLRQGYESCRHLLLLNVREALTTVTMQNMWLYREHAQTETRAN